MGIGGRKYSKETLTDERIGRKTWGFLEALGLQEFVRACNRCTSTGHAAMAAAKRLGAMSQKPKWGVDGSSPLTAAE